MENTNIPPSTQKALAVETAYNSRVRDLYHGTTQLNSISTKLNIDISRQGLKRFHHPLKYSP